MNDRSRRRLDPHWVVFDSVENETRDACVDLFRRPDGSFGFETFRRDVEDAGLWTATAFHAGLAYPTEQAARAAAARAVVWLAEAMGARLRPPRSR